MRKMIMAVLLVVLSAFLLVNCRERGGSERLKKGRIEVLREYAALDKAYIPALVLTNQGNIQQSQKAMTRFKEVWEAFANKHYPLVPKDPEFRRSLDKVQNAVRTADQIVNSGENLEDAHVALEEIRFILMALRKSRLFFYDREKAKQPEGGLGIPHVYYIDNLTEFHEPMEVIVLTAKGKTPETLTNADIMKIKEHATQASKLLVNIESAEFDPSIFDFDNSKTETMNGYLNQEADSLDKLKSALEYGDKNEIIQASLAIKPPFVELFTMFGDFESLK